MSFSDKMKTLRKEKGYTQNNLALLLNVSQNAIYNWENGKREPSIDMIKKIADALDTSISYFLDDDLFDAATDTDSEYEEQIIDEKIKTIMGNRNLSSAEKENQMRDLMISVGIMAQMHQDNVDAVEKFLLNHYFNMLNGTGRKKALEQVEMLTKISEFQKDSIEDNN